jgi:hypothetical protein
MEFGSTSMWPTIITTHAIWSAPKMSVLSLVSPIWPSIPTINSTSSYGARSWPIDSQITFHFYSTIIPNRHWLPPPPNTRYGHAQALKKYDWTTSKTLRLATNKVDQPSSVACLIVVFFFFPSTLCLQKKIKIRWDTLRLGSFNSLLPHLLNHHLPA